MSMPQAFQEAHQPHDKSPVKIASGAQQAVSLCFIENQKEGGDLNKPAYWEPSKYGCQYKELALSHLSCLVIRGCWYMDPAVDSSLVLCFMQGIVLEIHQWSLTIRTPQDLPKDARDPTVWPPSRDPSARPKQPNALIGWNRRTTRCCGPIIQGICLSV